MIDTVSAPPHRASNAGAAAAQIRDAFASQRPLRIVGAGTWPTGGAPIDATSHVSCESRDVIEYTPADLTITVGGGMSLSAIEAVTAPNRQWLTLDPFGSPDGTIGATVATASSGPLATGFGTPRDLLLGIEAITGSGAVIRAGGRVVKNVAGFDLTRLFTGSRGSLGVITEVSLRLRARPAQDTTVTIPITSPSTGFAAIGDALRKWPFTPMAAEIINARAAAAIGLRDLPTVLLRLGGNSAGVISQRKRATALGRLTETDSSIWARLRAAESGAVAVMRISDLPSAFPQRWNEAQALCGDDGVVIGSPSRGVLRCVLTEFGSARIATFRTLFKHAAIVFETLPNPSAWHALTIEPAPDSIEGRVRAAFDPGGIMNPGILRVAR